MALVEMVPLLVLGPRRRLDAALDLVMAQEGVQVMPAPDVLAAQPLPSDDAPLRLAHMEHQITDLRAALPQQAGDRDAPQHSVDWSSWNIERIAAWLEDLEASVKRAAQADQEAASAHEALAGFAAAIQAMEPILQPLRGLPGVDLILLVVPAARQPSIAELVRAIGFLSGQMPLAFHARAGEERVATLLALSDSPPGLRRALEASGLTHMELPPAASSGIADLLRTLADRTDALAAGRKSAQRDLETLARRYHRSLDGLEAEVRRRLRRVPFKKLARGTARLFVLGIWAPPSRAQDVRACFEAAGCGLAVVDPPAGADIGTAPMIAHNVALAAPYEIFNRWLPGAAYARVDLTPFIALSFPTFVGLMVADAGYGAAFLAIGAALRWWGRTTDRGHASTAGRILIHCGLLTVAFGVLFGEIFGMRWVIRPAPFLYDRRETPLPYLYLVMGVGAGHLLTGYLIGLWTAVRGRAWKRGMRLVAELASLTGMGLLLALQLGAAPPAMRLPGVLLLAAALILMVYAAGFAGPFEIPSVLAALISYVRLFAVGLASASLARAANQVAGLFGSALLGLLAAVLLHLISLSTSLISPLVQAARLQLVEFGGRAGMDAPPRHGGSTRPKRRA